MSKGAEPKEMRQHLIDADGRWWLWPSLSLAERLGHSVPAVPEFDLCGHAVRNLGCISVVLDRGLILLQYRPAMTTPKALASLTSYLAGAGATAEVILVFYLGGWTEEFIRSGTKAAVRIAEIAEAAKRERKRQPFIAAAKRLEELLAGPSNALTRVIDLWRERGRRFDPALWERINISVDGRSAAMQPSEDGSRMIVRHCGHGFAFYADRRVYQRTIGRDLSEQPDAAYGNWVAQAYRSVAASGQPALADIDAIVCMPGHEPHRSRYRRLILPWQIETGRLMLTATSLLRPDIDIPLEL